MSISLNPGDVREIVEIASIVGTIVSILLFAIVAYFLVRPKRGRPAPSRPDPDRIEIEEMLALIDRMERRLAVLERAMPETERPRRVAAPESEEI
jgi:hypothetical protein